MTDEKKQLIHDIAQFVYKKMCLTIPLTEDSLVDCFETLQKMNQGDAQAIHLIDISLFSLAREIGSIVLHQGLLVSPSKRRENCLFTTDIVEQTHELNQFALALLMPESEISKFIDAGDNLTLEFFAESFGVSKTLAHQRLKELGIID